MCGFVLAYNMLLFAVLVACMCLCFVLLESTGWSFAVVRAWLRIHGHALLHFVVACEFGLGEGWR